MPTEEPDHNAPIDRIKNELAKLSAAQWKALDDAVYKGKGMSRNEAKEYDERLTQIKKLVADLARLCEGQ